MRSRSLVAGLCSAAAVCAVPSLAVASEAPSWGPVKATGKQARILTDTSSVNLTFGTKGKADDIDEALVISFRVPSSSTTARATKLLTTTHPLINGGRRFPLARVVATARFTLLQRGYTEKIFSSNFDRYWNVCVNGAKSVTAEGGDVYCTVWHPERVRMVRSARITNYPRPKIIAETDLGPANPKCTVGTQQLATGSSKRTAMLQECRDGVSETGADWSKAKRTIRVTARVFNGKTWVESSSDTLIEAAGPGWVDIGEQARPGPTIALTSMTSEAVEYLGTRWTLRGTVTNNYGGTCWIDIYGKSTNGSWYQIDYLSSMSAGSTLSWGPTFSWYTSSKGDPTGEIEARPYNGILC